jgi:hypothetical protein
MMAYTGDEAISMVAYESLSELEEKMRRANGDIMLGNPESSRGYYLLEVSYPDGNSHRIGLVSRSGSPAFTPKVALCPQRSLLVVMLDATVHCFRTGGSRPVKSLEIALETVVYDYLVWDQVQLLVIFETGVMVLNMVTDTYAIMGTDVIEDYEVSESGLRIREDNGRSVSIMLPPRVPTTGEPQG